MNSNLPFANFPSLLREEFKGFGASVIQKDVLAGITVAAVALPLALAFGIASGADPAAGLVTAILAGVIIGGLSGAAYQISGPTGAMSAVLIVIANRHGLEAVLFTGVVAGVLMLLLGVLKLGGIVAFIPSDVITGFTSGIAIIIFVGQIDNFLGVKTPAAESAIGKAIGYFEHSFAPNLETILIGSIVIATMLLLPKRIGRRVPGSLIGLVLATVAAGLLNLNVPLIGDIPRTLLLDQRLQPTTDWSKFDASVLLFPALSVAALGAIESLLCGTVGSKMTGKRFDSDQELVAQGIGNIVIPFFGGVPATAAIARTSVAIGANGQTRLVSIVHSLVLLLAAFAFAPLIGRVPLAALSGVLMVTAVRMNDWAEIRWMFRHGFKSAIAAFLVTMLATAALDLTQAIIIGVGISAILFIRRLSNVSVTIKDVDADLLRERGHDIGDGSGVKVAYIVGPMFFGATPALRKAFAAEMPDNALILSMRGVPAIDTSGLEIIEELHERAHKRGAKLLFAAVQPNVRTILDRARVTEEVGAENFFWAADQAILVASNGARVASPAG